MNQKNSLGLNECFLDMDNPFDLFKIWMEKAKKSEVNHPNATSLATSDKDNNPSVRMVLLKSVTKDGFIFYTNLNSKKSLDIKENPKASMCFYWKSLLRQVRINGSINMVEDVEADKYFNTRDYDSRINAWASEQSKILKKREDLLNKIQENAVAMLEEVKKLKPASVKGLYIQSIALSSTMGPGVKVAPSSLV